MDIESGPINENEEAGNQVDERDIEPQDRGLIGNKTMYSRRLLFSGSAGSFPARDPAWSRQMPPRRIKLLRW